jgi:hypothetical protein
MLLRVQAAGMGAFELVDDLGEESMRHVKADDPIWLC